MNLADLTITGLRQQLKLNPAIFYALSLRAWQLLAGPVTLLIIAHFFSATEQGYFYSFNSILLLQIFFEMGLSYVLIQFISHEFAHLRWGKYGSVRGGIKIRRFRQLVVKAFHWYWWIAIGFFISVLPIGLVFFNLKSSYGMAFSWRLPWIFLVLGTTVNLLVVPLLAVIEGSGQVLEVNRLRFFQNLVATVISWWVMIFGGGLLCAAAISLTNALISVSWLLLKKPALIRLVLLPRMNHRVTEAVFCWRTEVWPMQWRIAVSWMAGYFINQIFVPILFVYQSPAVAGQMGMSLALATMLVFIGQAWLSAKAPFFGRLIAQREWFKLDRLFYQTAWQSMLMVIVAGVSLWAAVALTQHFAIVQRLLPPSQLVFLVGSAVLTHGINCVAQYLRSYKREPFMVLSVIGALFTATVAWYGGRYYSSAGIVMAVFLINGLYGLPTALLFWYKCRRVWQEEG